MAKGKTVVAIGPREELAYLRAAGVQFLPLAAGEDLDEALRERALDPAVGLIIVSETLAEGRLPAVAALRRETGAVILVVPSHRGSKGTTLQLMKHTLEQSIGVDLISKG